MNKPSTWILFLITIALALYGLFFQDSSEIETPKFQKPSSKVSKPEELRTQESQPSQIPNQNSKQDQEPPSPLSSKSPSASPFFSGNETPGFLVSSGGDLSSDTSAEHKKNTVPKLEKMVRVTGPTGKVLSGVRVETRHLLDQNILLVSYSDVNGLADLATDKDDLMVIAFKDGLAPGGLGHINSSNTKQPIELQLNLGTPIHGHVEDESGKILSDIDILVHSEIPSGGCEHTGKGLLKTMSDPEGHFFFEHAPLGTIALEGVSKVLICIDPATVQTPHPDSVAVIMESGQQRKCKVIDTLGKPIANAEISIGYSIKSSKDSNQNLAAHTSDDSGQCSLVLPKQGWLFISAKHDNYLSTSLKGISSGEASDIVLTLDKGISLKAKVIDAENKEAIKDAVVTIKGRYKGEYDDYTKHTNVEGETYFKTLPPELTSITVSATGYIKMEDLSFKQEVPNPELYTLKLHKGETQELKLVTKDQKPIAMDEVIIEYMKLDQRYPYFEELWRGSSNEDGIISVSGFNAGRYLFNIKVEGFIETTCTVEEESHRQTLVLQKASILSLQLNLESEAPDHITIRKINLVESHTHENENPSSWDVQRNATTGNYVLSNLAPGEFEFEIKVPGYLDSELQKTLLIEGATTEHSLDLKAGGYIDLKLICPDGSIYKDDLSWTLQNLYHDRNEGSLKPNTTEGTYKIFENPKMYTQISLYPYGYLPIENISLDSMSANEQKNILRTTLQLKEGEAFNANLNNTNGDPIVGAEISIYAQPQGLSTDIAFPTDDISPVKSITGTSDRNGSVHIKGLIKSSCVINIRHDDYLAIEEEIDLNMYPIEGKTFTMLNGKNLLVGVKNEAGETLPNIKLLLRPSREENDIEYYATETTGSDGTTHFHHLPNGQFTLQLEDQLKGWAEAKPIVVTGGSTIEECTWLTLKKGDHIGGRVIDDLSIPISGISIQLNATNIEQYVIYDTKSDAEGHFELNNIQPGEYKLYIHSGTHELNTEGMNVLSGHNDIVVHVKKMAVLKGKVQGNDGEPITDYELLQGNPIWGGMNPIFTLIIDKDSHFELPLQKSEYDNSTEWILMAQSAQFGSSQKISIDLKHPPREELTFVIPKKNVLMLDVMDSNGRKLSRVEAKCIPEHLFSPDAIGESLPFYSNGKGQLRFTGISDGEYFIYLSGGENYCDQVLKIQSVGHDESNPYPVVMTPGAFVKGTIGPVDQLSSKTKQLVITRLDAPHLLHYSRTTQVNPQGTYLFKNLVPGNYRISFGIPRNYGYSFPQPNDTLTDIQLSEGETLNLNLTIPEDEEAGSIHGHLTGLNDHDRIWGIELYSANPNGAMIPIDVGRLLEDDKFAFESVTAGQYLIFVRGDKVNLRKDFTLAAKEHLKLELYVMVNEIKAEIVDARSIPLDQAQAILLNAGTLTNQYSLFDRSIAEGFIENGRLLIKGVSPGLYDLLILPMNSKTIPPHILKNLNVTENGLDLGLVSLPLGRQMKVNIVNASGQPIVGAGVGAILSQGDILPSLSVMSLSNFNGILEFCLPQDISTLIVNGPKVSSRNIPIAELTETIILSSGATLHVSLKGFDIEGWNLELLDAKTKKPIVEAMDRSTFVVGFNPPTLSNTEGKASFINASPGKRVMRISKNDQVFWSEPFVLLDGQLSELQMKLEATF